ncbi:NLR family CARD domain-containing protein 4-like, partial [Anneissia japonica]|uniref:NLR family CARD domain-containing protein 4-like n=1 Tax=Anneissia japonica TaxID=1529436 RepID=UPI0014256221
MNLKSSGNGEASPQKKLKLDKDSAIKNYLLEQQKECLKQTRYYCPPTYNDDELDIHGLFTELELVKRDGRGRRLDAVPASLEEILDVIKSKDSCKVLIEGEGGMGKTTLLRYISYRWANEIENTFYGKIVFLIDIRDLKSDENVMDIILNGIYVDDFNQTQNMDVTIDEFGSFIRTHGSEVVLLLDGLDELNPKARHPIDIFIKKILRKSNVILSSRPGNTKEIARESDVYVKVLGFNSKNIEKFIYKFFKNEPKLGKSLITELHKYKNEDQIDEKSKLYDLCRSPMLLLSICTMWKENQYLPPNLASLFEELFCCILNQYKRKKCLEIKVSNFANIQEMYKRCFSILGKCMYESLKKNKFSIEFDDLTKYNSNGDENNLALAIGILYEEVTQGAQNHSKFYTAPHKLIAESLAGFFLCRQCQKEKSFSTEELDTIRSNEYLHMTRVFAVNFLGADADKLLQHWITNNGMDYRSLMEYLMRLEITQQQIVAQRLDAFISGVNLAIKKHFPSICDSLRMFVHPDIEICINDHLIQQLREVRMLEIRSCSSAFKRSLDAWIEAKSSVQNPAHKMLSHMLFAAKDQRCITTTKAFLSGSYTFFEDITTEFGNLKLVYDDGLDLDFSSNNVSRFLIVHLLNFVPDVLSLNLVNCSLSDTFINSVFSKCHSNLSNLDISMNKLTGIKGFLNNMPNLFSLTMENCSLSGAELEKMVSSLNMSASAALEILELKDNIFRDIEGITLSTLLVNAPVLDVLDVRNCQLSSVVIKDMVSDLKKNEKILVLTHFKIDNNSLNDIEGHTLSDLLYIAPDLVKVSMRGCNLVGTIVNNMILNCPIHNKLQNLDISYNNLSDIDELLLFRMRRKFPNIKWLGMQECQLKGTIIRDMLDKCDTLDASWGRRLNIYGNILHDIDDATIYALLKLKAEFDLFECISTVKQLDALIAQCVNENIMLECDEVDIGCSQLQSIAGATLGNLLNIAPKIVSLHLRNCSLS